MTFNYIKSLFGFKTKKRVLDIVIRLERHLINKQNVNKLIGILNVVSQSYKNKRKILKISKSKNIGYCVNNKSVVNSVTQIISLQLRHLEVIKSLLLENNSKLKKDFFPIEKDLAKLTITVEIYNRAMEIILIIEKLLSALEEYQIKLHQQETQLISNKNLGDNLDLWNEDSNIQIIEELLEKIESPEKELRKKVEEIKQAKLIFDIYYGSISGKINKLFERVRTYQFWTKDGEPLQEEDIDRIAATTYRNRYGSFQDEYKIFVQQIEKEYREIRSEYYKMKEERQFYAVEIYYTEDIKNLGGRLDAFYERVNGYKQAGRFLNLYNL